LLAGFVIECTETGAPAWQAACKSKRMRMCSLMLIATIALGLSGCARKDDNRDRSAAREAGRAAYKLREQSKRAAKELGRDLKQAGKEMREGWNEARREKRATPAGK
jgi:hypothetical protein